MLCPRCQVVNRSERRFCHACAAPLASVECPDCSFVNYPGERYCGGCARDLDATEPSREIATPAASAERRQVTVMFCDMVGSTALSAQLDAEALRDLIAAFQGACAAQVASFDGYIARYMGDGMLVYFGYPRAHEDAAERAVRAGLAIVDAVAALSEQPVQPRVRVGIATGRVVVGDIIGEGASEEHAVVGETPNLAARLQGLAEPDTVVISDRSRRLIGARFEVEDLGKHELKGFPEPVPAWRAVCEATRVQGRRGSALPLVGRQFERSVLEDRWNKVGSAGGAVVAIAGDPGSGKSHLIESFVEHPDTDSGRVVRYLCSRHAATAALSPVVEQLTRVAGIELEDDIEARRHKLRRYVDEWSADADHHTSVLARLLSLEEEDDGASPAQRRREILETLWSSLTSREEPTLVIVEDLQWADPTTLSFVEGLIGRTQTHALMLVLTHRPDFETPWRSPQGMTSLSLGRLGRDDARELIARVAGETPLRASVIDTILQRADGVPDYLVELTRAVVSTPEGSGAASPDVVPETLHDSLAAQLDGIGAARRVAQTAAVLGRTFSRELLARIAEQPEDLLDRHLAALVDAGLLSPPESGVYAFRHALVCDAAYESLLTADQRVLHDRVATLLVEQLPAAADADPIATARHLSKAGRGREAAVWWVKAAERASRQAAFIEAASHRRCAVVALEPVCDRSDAADSQRLAELLIELALELRVASGVGEAAAALDQAEEVLKPHDLPATLSHVYFSRGNLFFQRGDIEGCKAAHERALRLAKHSGSALAEARALGGLADAHLLAADRPTGAGLARQCVELAMAHGFDRIVAANASSAAFGYYLSLQRDEARRMLEIAERYGEKVQMQRALMITRNVLALMAADGCDTDEAVRQLRRRDESMAQDPVVAKMLFFVDYLVYRMQGRWRDGHAFVLETLRLSFPESLKRVWGCVHRACLIAEAPDDEFEGLVRSTFDEMRQTAANSRDWALLLAIQGLVHRAAWDHLAELVDRFADLIDPKRGPLVSLWMDAARVALAWADDPGDAQAKADVERSIESARSLEVGSIEWTLREMLGAEVTVESALA